jgi:hypothetical protein
VSVTGDLVDLDEDEPTTPAWHERTATVVGASIAALLALILMYFGVSCVAQGFDSPNQEPQYYLDPGVSSSRTLTTTSTTSTITSTSPPVTTDINPNDTPTSSSDSSTGGATTRPRTTTNNDDSTTTSRRPRFNQTRVFPRLTP